MPESFSALRSARGSLPSATSSMILAVSRLASARPIDRASPRWSQRGWPENR